MKIKTLNKSWLVMLTSMGLMVLLMIALVCPAAKVGVQAADCIESDTSSCVANTASTQASVKVAPTIAVALQDKVEMDVSPTKEGEFVTTTADLAVSTNNATGYSLYLQSGNGRNTLVGSKTGNTATIAPVTGIVNQASFQNNTWGYNFDDTASETTTYTAVPTSQTTLTTTEVPVDTHYNLSFATKVDTTLPADQYSNSVLVSAVANPPAVTGLLSITNMQDMTSTVCSESTEGDTKQLIDIRDNKSYWVAKLKDGNCWMTQNLALDITADGLKAVDTDIARDWTTSQSADPSVTTVYSPKRTETALPTSNDTTNTVIRSWNLGSYQLVDPMVAKSCDGAMTMSDCISQGIIATNITDEHYKLGNYYTWNAATAGTGGLIYSVDAVGSICPKNWQLPGAYSGSTHPTFENLLDKYGINFGGSGNNVDEKSYNIASEPLYFVRGGGPWDTPRHQTGPFDWEEASRFSAGYDGTYLSSYGSAYPSDNSDAVYGLTISGDSVDDSRYNLSRYTPMSVRCVAR